MPDSTERRPSARTGTGGSAGTAPQGPEGRGAAAGGSWLCG
jgi:hypothetical protein